MRISSDTGGTFTDLVTSDGRIMKVPSTPDDPGRAVRNGLLALNDAQAPVTLVHGTTVATNTLLERRGASVALVTNAGFADVIEIARQARPSLYDPHNDRPEPLVTRNLRFEVAGRIGPDGGELVPINLDSLDDLYSLDPPVEAVAVCLLHSDLNGAHERHVVDELERRGFDVSASCDLSPEYREYERTVTTVVNAYLRPRCRSYLWALSDATNDVLVMTSAGGLMPVVDAADRPAAMLLSGPSGGVAAGASVAVANGYPDAVTFDMGGTSTDVCLVLDGVPEPASQRSVGGFPIRMPSLDVHTIGAGGGSIAALDQGGALVVGPRSAGAIPGPACYGLGGTEPTVTDANLIAGHLSEGIELPGIGVLDHDAARLALEQAGVTAEGVLAVVNEHMAQALRHVSVERGVDPRTLALVAFGGAGPLHACALADSVGMSVVIIPARAGVLSAVGILTAPRQVDLVRSWTRLDDHAGAELAVCELGKEALDRLSSRQPNGGDMDASPDAVVTTLDCRYEGQSHEIRVTSVEAFHEAHRRLNGYARPDHPIEVVAIRATATRESPVAVSDLPVVERQPCVGPAVITEPDCTIWLPEGWSAEPGVAGALIVRRTDL